MQLAAGTPLRRIASRSADIANDDLYDAARRVAALDLVMTVDSMTAPLAGALGVPVWTLLVKDADWRWMEGRDDSPWYPTMRLFRQGSPGDWSDVVASVKYALQARGFTSQCIVRTRATRRTRYFWSTGGLGTIWMMVG